MKLEIKDGNFKPTLKEINTMDGLFMQIDKLENDNHLISLISLISLSNSEDYIEFEATKRELFEGAEYDIIEKADMVFVVITDGEDSELIDIEELEITEPVVEWYLKKVNNLKY